MKKSFYGPFYYFCRFVLRIFMFGLKPFTFSGEMPEGPFVLIAHHHNMRGPIRTMVWFPQPLRIWALHVFYEKKDCFDQYYGYTFTKRFGWPKPLAWLCAKMASGGISRLMHSMGAVPVYRGTTHMRKTLSMSLDALYAGESLVIFPDIDYSSNEDEMGEIYSGFLGLERFYYKKTGRHLPFVPIGIDEENRRFLLGEAICFTDDAPFAQQKDKIAARIRDSINTLETGKIDPKNAAGMN